MLSRVMATAGSAVIAASRLRWLVVLLAAAAALLAARGPLCTDGMLIAVPTAAPMSGSALHDAVSAPTAAVASTRVCTVPAAQLCPAGAGSCMQTPTAVAMPSHALLRLTRTVAVAAVAFAAPIPTLYTLAGHTASLHEMCQSRT
jgi:hypothetical protein